ncbi:mitochondrial fission ELM1 family protein [Guyparkeria halopsychrophila]|uniref:mitochondrial fission ELM1 family protein n=1 Tax=Guyparkeria halopsychrophila TaxID=3139421 RepID=UPI0037C6396F
MPTHPDIVNEIWAVTTGEAGMANQARGLAEAVAVSTGWPVVQKTIGMPRPWRWLPMHWVPLPLDRLSPDSDHLAPPWPRVLITCGRRSAAASIAIRKASGGRCFTVHVQDPLIPPRYFDLVAPPRHDGLAGPNVLPTRGAIHHVTQAKLDQAAGQFRTPFETLPRPWIGVLLGGSNRTMTLTPEKTRQIGEQLASAARDSGGSLLITPSRRTGEANTRALAETIREVPHQLWQGEGPNPYFGILALADYLVVSGDSASMVSEAASTGRPLYVIDFGMYSKRLARFHRELREEGVTRAFDGSLEHWDYQPVDDSRQVAAVICERVTGER